MRKTSKIDLHVHTLGSDGRGTPKQIADNAVKAGLDGICLTDHHRTYTTDSLEVARECRKRGLLVIHGCEYSTAQSHLLVYGVNIEDLELGRYPEMQAVINEVNRRGGACVPAHPFKTGYSRTLCDDVFKLKGIRAIEAANGQCTFQMPQANSKAVKAAHEMSLFTTGGSDAHNPKHIGLTYTEFDGVIRTEKDFIKALRRGSFRAVTSRKRVKKERGRRRKSWGKEIKPVSADQLNFLPSTSVVASLIDNSAAVGSAHSGEEAARIWEEGTRNMWGSGH